MHCWNFAATLHPVFSSSTFWLLQSIHFQDSLRSRLSIYTRFVYPYNKLISSSPNVNKKYKKKNSMKSKGGSSSSSSTCTPIKVVNQRSASSTTPIHIYLYVWLPSKPTTSRGTATRGFFASVSSTAAPPKILCVWVFLRFLLFFFFFLLAASFLALTRFVLVFLSLPERKSFSYFLHFFFFFYFLSYPTAFYTFTFSSFLF